MKLTRKKFIVTLLIVLLVLSNFCLVWATSEELSLISQAAFLMDNKTGKVLYAKNEDEKMFPASTTKIMTAILTLENCNLDEIVTVSYDAIMSIPEGYSTASLQVDEQLSVEQLLELLLIHSANDAANCLAQYVGGSVESFVSMMNTKVHELGITHTHFTNAYGMHDDDHYTTAHDLALIMQYCIKNDDFRRIAGSSSCTLPATNKYTTRSYPSTNELILPDHPNYYPYLTCGKTGYTTQAGDCLVSCSYQNNLELICVILGGKTINGVSTRFSETKTLFEFGFRNFANQTILKQNDVVTQVEVSNGSKDTRNLDLLSNRSIEALIEIQASQNDFSPEIHLNEIIQAPIEQGDVLGSVSYLIDGVYYQADLFASHDVEKSKILNFILEIGSAFIVLLLIYYLFFAKKKHR